MRKYLTGLKTDLITYLKLTGKPKIFCIGQNKTGTTSLKQTFEQLGYLVGSQRSGELLLPNYIDGNFKPIIQYCRTAQVFQDIPFSLPKTYEIVDKAFPNSKFILSIRDSPEQWYKSITNFHGKMFGGGNVPSLNDLKNADYVYKGFMWDANRAIYDSPETDPYQKQILLNSYENYNQNVIKHFEGTNKLLVINLAAPGSYQRFCDFLSIQSERNNFPWENRTEDLAVRK